jgi:hypothetical protein
MQPRDLRASSRTDAGLRGLAFPLVCTGCSTNNSIVAHRSCGKPGGRHLFCRSRCSRVPGRLRRMQPESCDPPSSGCRGRPTPSPRPAINLEPGRVVFVLQPRPSSSNLRESARFRHVPLRVRRLLAGFYRVDVSGQNMRQIHADGFGASTMSKDGAWIYYERGGQIWRIARVGDTLDVATAVQVTNSSQGAFSPSVSWSGTRLLYDVSGTGANPGIFITGVEGGPARHVGGFAWVSPDWGPRDSSFAPTGKTQARAGLRSSCDRGEAPSSSRRILRSGRRTASESRSCAVSVAAGDRSASNKWSGTGARRLSIDGTIPVTTGSILARLPTCD